MDKATASGNYSTDPQEFINYVARETNKVLEMFSASGGDDIFRQFTQSWTELATRSLEDPTVWIRAIADYQQAQFNLWRNLMSGTSGETPVVQPERGDRRFQSDEWSNNPIYDYIKQSYLLTSRMLVDMAANAKLAPSEQAKLEFYTKQYVDALSPTNFALTNPEVLQQAMETKGQSLVDGLKNLLGDIEKGRISMTDESAFELGTNLATTEGAVVFQNELFQLIHYKPEGEQVYERPTLIVPPSINKFYILDLQPHNSFVKYCVEQGQDVYLVSWVNPTVEQRDLSWDDYVSDGVLKAIQVTCEISGSEKLNAVAWCVGGTLLTTALAVMANRKDTSVGSATFLTTLTDFSNPGDLCVFIDDYQVKQLESKVNSQGILNGRELATSFNMLRSNDLIWSYVVNNYLKGQTPPPFDILYWNSDSTNLPAAMYTFYINKMYLENKLVEPNGLEICGEPIDLGKIKIPCYFLSTIEDHIAPWKGTFNATETFGSTIEFVLGASGHVAGVINPASKNRRNYWVKGEQGKGADHWLETAERQEGSWWPNWAEWVRRRAGKKVDAPKEYGNDTYKVIEPAPGSYVSVRID
ncbi:Polyhydroxyalkanoic acid synthase [Marinobacterium lacunae]|uniref:Polyhydroxyalkanoic acid synthase n=1 Tax=Marinobacterium lacunae TaxID=1232683 RepID=A0A081FW93_9GAMM|nr:class I poly(R)-hydroxyalkanoic acid synthase [Marinobacterium lacunae]KEA62798.1 Polyhydroxyalkanoic acid synthase [Marinobacterium lacunae]MBR9883841.1 class I poly(R)-hydroxyalkanoic acid synthase [Oceanospirillales bacterium]